MLVRVVRPLCVNGKRQEVGQVLDLPNAAEAISTGRAERVTEAPPAVGPMTTESVPDLIVGKRKKKEQSYVAS